LIGEGTIEDAAAALKQAYDEGVRSYIDPTTFDLGRDIGMMQEVSRQRGVHIIPATGSHQAIPRVFRSASPDAIAPLYIREVEEGIEGTGVKAAIIKSASDRGGMTEQEELGACCPRGLCPLSSQNSSRTGGVEVGSLGVRPI